MSDDKAKKGQQDSWLGMQSSGFTNVQPAGWLLVAAGGIVAYLVPVLVCRLVYWVIDGFKMDGSA